VPIEDAKELPFTAVREAVDFVLDQKTQGRKVLIACSGSFSRSVVLGCAALTETEELSLADALRDIQRVHPEARPHPCQWASLSEYDQRQTNSRLSPKQRRRRRKR
jgi:protein-tyrosine phosphatase